MLTSQKIVVAVSVVFALVARIPNGDCQNWQPIAGNAPAERANAGKVTAFCGETQFGAWYTWGAAATNTRMFFWGQEEEFGNAVITARYWTINGTRYDVQKDQALEYPFGSASGTCTATFTVTAREKEYSSSCKVTVLSVSADPVGIWYFAGETPTGYPTTTTWTAAGATEGTYVWEITKGQGIIEFANGTQRFESNQPSVTIRSTSYSQDRRDVAVELAYRNNQGCPLTSIHEFAFEVSSPVAVVTSFATTPSPINGYQTRYYMMMMDRVGCLPMQTSVAVNEDFGTWSPNPEPWGKPSEMDTMTAPAGNYQTFMDTYRPPIPPRNPEPIYYPQDGYNTLVQKAWQRYHAGSGSSGDGLLVHSHWLALCRGYAYQF